jgi:stage II sporulation protein D
MGGFFMWQKVKQAICYMSIILLLPYVITVFFNGSEAAVNAGIETTYVMVEHEGERIEMSIEDYCIGRLAKEIPTDNEEEALKAQAVLVRTAVYKKIKETGSAVVLEDEFWTLQEMKKQWGATGYNKNYKKFTSTIK